MRVGVLTGGGDCPALNAVLRAFARRGERTHRIQMLGFRDGWAGVLEQSWEPLTIERCRGILTKGGTILGTSRVTPFQQPDGLETVRRVREDLELDGFVVLGGEGSLAAASELHNAGIPTFGIPKTIDNDVAGTDVTFGFDTAVATATESIDRLHSTAEAHDRVMVVEVMGRHAGHIAMHAGVAGGAALVLIPERPFDIAEVAAKVSARHRSGRFASVVVVAEGARPVEGTMTIRDAPVDEYGHRQLGGIASRVAAELQERTGIDCRVTSLGYVQRGGKPSAYDRVLSTWFGVSAANAVAQGEFGSFVALRNGDMVVAPLSDVVGRVRLARADLYELLVETFEPPIGDS